MAEEILLQLKNISVHYGVIKALDDISLSIDGGEIIALMGPNGAGKSTVLKAIFGLVPAKGQILWHEEKIEPKPDEMVRRGITLVPQGRRIFTGLTVRENLEMGAFWVTDKSELARRLKEVSELFPVLKSKQLSLAGILSGGEQQMLALGRGLMADLKILLLDEPSLGLSPKFVEEVFAKIKEINDRHKTTIIIVEHNIRSVLDVAHRGYVLNKGKIIASGASVELKDSNMMQEVFLGRGE